MEKWNLPSTIFVYTNFKLWTREGIDETILLYCAAGLALVGPRVRQLGELDL